MNKARWLACVATATLGVAAAPAAHACWEQAAQSRNKRAALEWHWGRFSADAELPVWMLALAARQLMTSDAMALVRACGAESCRWLFLDTSKNHTRRWCSMQACGNRMKARRFQARHG